MNTQYAAQQWATSPPFRPDSGQRPSTTMSALSKGSGSMAQRNSESIGVVGGGGGAAAGWNGSSDGFDAAPYAADAFGNVQPHHYGGGSSSSPGAGLVSTVTGANGMRALVKADGSSSAMAVATTYPSTQLRHAAFSGLYDDVAFPVHSLFTPPRPPGELLPRTQRPARNKPIVYANDVARAGMREHNAQRAVSRVWRGVLCRRRLRQARAMDSSLNEKARVLQCWWRCYLATQRRKQLSALRDEWAKERAARYIDDRVRNTTSILYWQHARYESAVLRIQHAVRWFLREKARQRCAAAGLPESEWPPSLQRPLAERHRPYFPWRRPRQATTQSHHQQQQQQHDLSGALVAVEEGISGAGADALLLPSARRTLLQFRATPREVPPPTQAEVEATNAKMRAAAAQRVAALQAPESVSRQTWKTEGLRQEDLDFNAGVLQRFYRNKKAPETIHTKDLTAAYFNKAARTIARTFRMYVLLKRMRARRASLEGGVQRKVAQRSAANIADLKSEAVWQKDLMDAAARSIQRCWAWYRHRHGAAVPAFSRARGAEPSPPPYGLLSAHIERERALRWSTMNLLEQRQYEEQQQHRYFHYTPEKIAVYEHTGFLFVQAPPSL